MEEFRRNYEIPNKPVVVTDCATHWPAINKWYVLAQTSTVIEAGSSM